MAIFIYHTSFVRKFIFLQLSHHLNMLKCRRGMFPVSAPKYRIYSIVTSTMYWVAPILSYMQICSFKVLNFKSWVTKGGVGKLRFLSDATTPSLGNSEIQLMLYTLGGQVVHCLNIPASFHWLQRESTMMGCYSCLLLDICRMIRWLRLNWVIIAWWDWSWDPKLWAQSLLRACLQLSKQET